MPTVYAANFSITVFEMSKANRSVVDLPSKSMRTKSRNVLSSRDELPCVQQPLSDPACVVRSDESRKLQRWMKKKTIFRFRKVIYVLKICTVKCRRSNPSDTRFRRPEQQYRDVRVSSNSLSVNSFKPSRGCFTTNRLRFRMKSNTRRRRSLEFFRFLFFPANINVIRGR